MSLTNKNKGFTLIELMIVIAIIAIVALMAIPAYSGYVERTRMRDCQGVLLSFAQAIERFFVVNSTYVGVGNGGTNNAGDAPDPAVFANACPLDGATKFYNLSIQGPPTVNTYTIRATPIAASAQGSAGMLELTSTGIRRWDKNNNGVATDAGENSWLD